MYSGNSGIFLPGQESVLPFRKSAAVNERIFGDERGIFGPHAWGRGDTPPCQTVKSRIKIARGGCTWYRMIIIYVGTTVPPTHLSREDFGSFTMKPNPRMTEKKEAATALCSHAMLSCV